LPAPIANLSAQRKAKGIPPMTQAHYSAVLDHPPNHVWSLIRDFNNYPAYIDGVSESLIEDDKGGDEIGRRQALLLSRKLDPPAPDRSL
jgi:hypothetical protein